MEATIERMTWNERTASGLVNAARAGDRAAFGRLVEPWLAPMLGGAIIITRSHA